jgi:hypothetical protein
MAGTFSSYKYCKTHSGWRLAAEIIPAQLDACL